MSKNITYGLGILLVALLLYFALFSQTQVSKTAGVSVGKPAPNFTLRTLEGKEVSLSDLRGKIVLVNFWATWCPPCREEMPLFEEVYRKYKDKGFEILAVSTDTSAEAVRKFVKEFKVSFPVLMDDGKVSTSYGIQGLPTSFLIDREGKVIKIRLGKYREVEKDVKEALE